MATGPAPIPDGYRHESPFAKLLDMRVADPDDGSSAVTMPINPSHLQDAGRVQGGIVATLADYAFFRAVKPLLKPGEATTTIEIKISYFKSVTSGQIICDTKIVNRGRKVVTLESEIRNKDRLVAKAIGTYYIILNVK